MDNKVRSVAEVEADLLKAMAASNASRLRRELWAELARAKQNEAN